MPPLSFDTLLLVSFVFPLTAAAIPLCATAKTLDDWFLHRGPKEDTTDDLQQQGSRTDHSSSHSLTSVPEEDEDQDETLIEQSATSTALPSALNVAVALKLFDERGQEGYLRRDDDEEDERTQKIGSGGEHDSENGRFDSFTSEFSKNYSTATSPAATLPSHFNRTQQNHPSAQSVFETFGARSDSPVPPHLSEEDVDDDGRPRSGSTTPSASHFRDASNGSSTASYTTTRTGSGRVSTSGSESDQPQIVMIDNDPSSLDHPPTPYPFSPGHEVPSHSSASSNSSAFTFRSALEFHHSGHFHQPEEEEVGLITPRASPEVTLGPALYVDGGDKDVGFDERVGVIGGNRGKAKDQELFPSPPPSHESSPSIQFSFDSPSHAARDASSSVSQASTTAVADIDRAQREKYADFREDSGGEGEDGLGLELRKGRKKLKGVARLDEDADAKFDEDAKAGRGRAGMAGSRSLRDGLKTDRPISTVSTSSTHAHLGSPQLPYFLPSSHSKPNLTPSSGSDNGSAVSTLRLASPPNFHSDDHSSSSHDHHLESSSHIWEPSTERDRARTTSTDFSETSGTSEAGSLSPTIGTSASSSPTTSFLVGGAEEAKMAAESERKKAKKARQRAKEKERKKAGKSKGGK
ncbi:hypothetical protein BDY24DRAFT_112427 [Mrakia frigida]|uniref:uncharacterized protein n=1 Tax=Mrakia frigida TaxID=29902 RepID=UPI003FCC1348